MSHTSDCIWLKTISNAHILQILSYSNFKSNCTRPHTLSCYRQIQNTVKIISEYLCHYYTYFDFIFAVIKQLTLINSIIVHFQCALPVILIIICLLCARTGSFSLPPPKLSENHEIQWQYFTYQVGCIQVYVHYIQLLRLGQVQHIICSICVANGLIFKRYYLKLLILQQTRLSMLLDRDRCLIQSLLFL